MAPALHVLCQEYETTWRHARTGAAAPPDLREFRDRLAAADHPRALRTLLSIDMELRVTVAKEDGCCVAEYLKSFPELRDDPRALGRLVRREIKLRRDLGH